MRLIMRRWDWLTTVGESEPRPFAYLMTIHCRTRRDPRVYARS
jgi:hypothetical protein